MDITPVVNTLIALIAAIITAFVIPWVKSKTTAAQREEIEAWVRIAVTAAEQIYSGSGKGKEKKKYVLDFLAEKNLKIDEESVDLMIESAVKEMNEAFNAPESIPIINGFGCTSFDNTNDGEEGDE